MHPRRPHLALLALLLAALVWRAPPVLADERSPAPSGGAVWPLSPVPEVAEGFDPPDSRWGPGHRGVDLAGSVGQPVRAALPGRVSFAGTLAGRGVVVVDHGATRTTYEPVDRTVSVGDTVAAGDRIGTLQLGGSHCFPAACLHWGLRAGDTYLDPLTLVGAGPVRLLPFGGDAPGSAILQQGSRRLPSWARTLRTPTSARWAPRLALGPAGAGALFRAGPAP